MSVDLERRNFPRIVFMGTPAFAVTSLEALVREGHNVVAVITAPDKPAGRGMKLTKSPVKEYAVSKNLKVMQPPRLKDELFLSELRSLHADLQVVIAFRMLPEVVWNMPPMGTINVHASLLPKYRGAAPINWAIINGESETGVTTFKLTHEIDTGNILLQEKIEIGDDENAGDVHNKLMHLGAELLIKTIIGMIDGNVYEKPQQNIDSPTHAPKIFTETSKINWNKPAKEIHNLVRGLSPYPSAFTELNGKKLKIFKSAVVYQPPSVSPGFFVTDHRTYLNFAATDGYLSILELQIEGKKKMIVEEFLRGFRKIS